MLRPALRPATLLLAVIAGHAAAEPFALDPLPAGFDGVVHPWSTARRPVAVDFDGDGRTSWYAGGNRVAHPKQATPLDPARYATATLPAISLPACPACTPRNLAFAAGDINRDGKPDIVRLNGWNGHSHVYTLQVLLGDGANGFGLGWREDRDQPPGYNAGDRYFQLVLEDIDRDGDPDLVVLSSYERADGAGASNVEKGSLSWRENDNQGFATETMIQSLHFGDEADLLVGDIDRDGDADIVVDGQITWTPEDTYSFQSRIFAGDGAGGFSATTMPWMAGIAHLADLNRDGWDDLVQAGGFSQGEVSWRENHHGGGFMGEATLTPVFGINQHALAAVADFDEDGTLDLVTAEGTQPGTSPRLVLRRGQGDGWLAAGPAQLAAFASDIVAIGTGDAAGDADADLLLRLASGQFHQLRNLAPRRRPVGATLPSHLSLPGVTRLEVADADRDGADDVFALQPGAGRLQRLLGDGNGGLGAPEFKILASGPRDFTLGDFDRDGRIDAAYTVPAANAVRTVMQNDSIYFAWSDTKASTIPGAALIRAGHGGTLNGSTDLLVSSAVDGGLRWLLNDGAATSWNPSVAVASQPLEPAGLALARGYAGFADAAFSCSADGVLLEVAGYSNLLGWHRTATLLQEDSAGEAGPCVAANLDADRTPEIVLVDGLGRLVWWDPTADLVSTTQVIAPGLDGMVNAIRPVDWDRDGLTDLLVATTHGIRLYARAGADDAWVGILLTVADDTGVADVVPIDFDRDSRPDAVYVAGDQLRRLENISSVGAGGGMVQASVPVVSIKPGATGIAHAYRVVNPGRLDEDASIAVTRARVSFRYAVPAQGNGWNEGASMPKAQLQQLVSSVSIYMDGLLIGTAGTADATADGRLTIHYTSLLGHAVPIAAGESGELEFRVKLAPGAAAAGIETFFLSQRYEDYGQVRVLHDGLPEGVAGELPSWGAARTRIVVDVPTPTPGGSLFSSGFE